jgi:hypothetical protein
MMAAANIAAIVRQNGHGDIYVLSHALTDCVSPFLVERGNAPRNVYGGYDDYNDDFTTFDDDRRCPSCSMDECPWFDECVTK